MTKFQSFHWLVHMKQSHKWILLSLMQAHPSLWWLLLHPLSIHHYMTLQPYLRPGLECLQVLSSNLINLVPAHHHWLLVDHHLAPHLVFLGCKTIKGIPHDCLAIPKDCSLGLPKYQCWTKLLTFESRKNLCRLVFISFLLFDFFLISCTNLPIPARSCKIWWWHSSSGPT